MMARAAGTLYGAAPRLKAKPGPGGPGRAAAFDLPAAPR